MVTLINLVKDGNLIRTDYYGEGETNDLGHIVYDISADKVVEKVYSKSESDTWYTYFSKAVIAIRRLVEYNKFPSTYHFLWY